MLASSYTSTKMTLGRVSCFFGSKILYDFDERIGKIPACLTKITTMIKQAAFVGDSTTAELILSGTDPGYVDAQTADGKGHSALHLAAAQGSFEVARLLLRPRREGGGGADGELRTRIGATALHIAVAKGHAEVAHLLMAEGCGVAKQGARKSIINI